MVYLGGLPTAGIQSLSQKASAGSDPPGHSHCLTWLLSCAGCAHPCPAIRASQRLCRGKEEALPGNCLFCLKKPTLYEPPVLSPPTLECPAWGSLVPCQAGIQGQQQVLDEILMEVIFLQPHCIPAGTKALFLWHKTHRGAL